MKATQIKLNHTYEVTSGRNTTTVKVESFNERTGGWNCETANGKSISIKDAARFLRDVTPETKVAKAAKTVMENAVQTEPKRGGRAKGRMSALSAAHEVLLEKAVPMNAKEITEEAISSGR